MLRIYLLVLFCWFGYSQRQFLFNDPDMDTVYSRLYQDDLGNELGHPCSSICSSAYSYEKSLKSDGSWPDINYQDQSTANWLTAVHWNPRIEDMARAYVCPQCNSSLYQNAQLINSTRSAIDYWLKNDFINPNWWWNQIGIPQDLEFTYTLILPQLTSYELTQANVILDRANYSTWTGENLIWGLQIQIVRGLLYNNTNWVQDGFTQMWAACVFASAPDGIAYDGSFWQHGALLQSASYGGDWTTDILQYINLAANTRFYITDSALNVMSTYVLDGQQYMIRSFNTSSTAHSNHWDYIPAGREITRSPGTETVDSDWGTWMANVPGPRQADWKLFSDRLLQGPSAVGYFVGNKHFWKNDYHTHHRNQFFFALKMFSTRTMSAECVNNEGLKSWHLSDGVLNTYQRGDEYSGIYPVWDWTKIPGTTIRQGGAAETECSTVKQYGMQAFAGGNSDGWYGVSAVQFESNNFGAADEKTPLFAAKTWAFIDEGVFALGANISLGTNLNVITVLNQCLLKGNVSVQGITNPLNQGNHSYTNVSWVWHDGVGYFFLFNIPSITIRNIPQTNSWYSVNTGQSQTPVTLNVFTLEINHGVQPKNGTYSYAILPGVTQSNMNSLATRLTQIIKLLHNGPDYQAILYTNPKNIISFMSTFYKSGNVNGGTGWNVTVNNPVILTIHDYTAVNKTIQIIAANPKNAALTVTLTIDRTVACPTTDWQIISDKSFATTNIQLVLPTGNYAGSSLVLNCTVS